MKNAMSEGDAEMQEPEQIWRVMLTEFYIDAGTWYMLMWRAYDVVCNTRNTKKW